MLLLWVFGLVRVQISGVWISEGLLYIEVHEKQLLILQIIRPKVV